MFPARTLTSRPWQRFQSGAWLNIPPGNITLGIFGRVHLNHFKTLLGARFEVRTRPHDIMHLIPGRDLRWKHCLHDPIGVDVLQGCSSRSKIGILLLHSGENVVGMLSFAFQTIALHSIFTFVISRGWYSSEVTSTREVGHIIAA